MHQNQLSRFFPKHNSIGNNRKTETQRSKDKKSHNLHKHVRDVSKNRFK